MAESAHDIAEDLIELLQINGKDVITIPWPEMYEFCDRERMKQGFKDQLKEALNVRTCQIDYGAHVVTVFRCTNFSPVKLSKK
jgi:hypothetical protein